MGQSMGPLAYPSQDFSARCVLDCYARKCEGTLYREDADLLSLLAPVLRSLGFTQPLTTGRYCGLYERTDAVMLCSGTPRANLENVRTFRLGGSNAGVLRRILGEVAKESSLEVEVNTWTPALR